MTYSLSIPTQDLLNFHQKHYSRSFNGVPPFTDASIAEETNLPDPSEEEDNLGHYPDGAKRTLTDAQIAIFRHSEIQRLLLAHLRHEEAIAERAAEKEARKDAGEVVSSDEGELEENDDDEEEYRKFREQEAKQFQRDAENKRNKKRAGWMKGSDGDDRTVSTRRKVREMDGDGRDAQQDEIVLDY